MSGIEKILSAIAENGEAEVSSIKAQADKQVALIAEKALQDSEIEKNKIAKETAAICEKNIQTATATANALVNRAVLSAKVSAVNGIICEAIERIQNLPDRQYFDFMAGLICAGAEKGDGEISFAKKDIDRLPDDFIKKLNEKLPQGSTLCVSKTPADIENGFLLKYKDIEINGSLDAVKEAKGELLKDAVAAVLFSR